MNYNGLLIPYRQERKRYFKEYFLDYNIDIKGYREYTNLKENYGYILFKTTDCNIKYKFFEFGGKWNNAEYTGQILTLSELKQISKLFINAHAYRTIKEFYLLNSDTTISFKYFINLIDDIFNISFSTGSINITNNNYTTQHGYLGNRDILTQISGEGYTIDNIVKIYKEKYNVKNINRNIYKKFLMSQGITFTKDRISGIKDVDVYSSANGGSGTSIKDINTFLFNGEYVETDLNAIVRFIEILKADPDCDFFLAGQKIKNEIEIEYMKEMWFQQ